MAGVPPASSPSLIRPPPERQLPPDLQLHILSFLAPNERALSGRLVSPDAAAALNDPQHCTASLSQPLPPHAAPWAQAGCWQQHVRQLSLSQKVQLLCMAAASGSEVNLEVARDLLQPSLFPEQLRLRYEFKSFFVRRDTDPRAVAASEFFSPCVAAVRAGYPQLLGWLLCHCPGLLWPQDALEAAARHCDLAGLQLAWRLLQEGCGSGSSNSEHRCPSLDQGVLDAAAESFTPDAVAKMEWILATAVQGTCSLQESTAAAAACSGDLGRLRWLRDRGCPVDKQAVLASALQYADLAVAQWLVDEGGCRLLQAGWTDLGWAFICLAAAKRADCLLKWQWLRDRGATPSPELLRAHLTRIVVRSGRVEGLWGLQLFPAMQTAEGRAALQQALDQEEGPRCIAMARQLQQEGYVLTHSAYLEAAWKGDLAMVRFLACEAAVPMAPMGLGELIKRWPRDTAARSRDLLQAVQLLVGGARHGDAVTEAVVCMAVRCGHMGVAQHLLQLLPGYQPGARLLYAAMTGCCEALLEWLVEHYPGCAWSRSAARGARVVPKGARVHGSGHADHPAAAGRAVGRDSTGCARCADAVCAAGGAVAAGAGCAGGWGAGPG